MPTIIICHFVCKISAAIEIRFLLLLIMHLSMLSPKVGGGGGGATHGKLN